MLNGIKSITKEQFKQYINDFNFTELFNIFGWDNFNEKKDFNVQDTPYTITGIAEKRRFYIFQCEVPQDKIPDSNIRKQLEKKIRGWRFLHLLIIIDKNKTEQHWQLPLWEDGKLTKIVSFSWRKGQDVEGLYQKLRNIVFTLDEEENLKLADVEERVNTFSANSEKVTKKFYAEFIKQHQAFLGFIKGIDDALPDDENEKKQWYASLMLNRLMFCYFIQKKRFLDWNEHYLREKLAECKELKGKNNFYGFYRSFLLELFHDELGRPQDKRPKPVSPVPFGVIPYLNGGLFDLHELETDYKKISIKDSAFEKLFVFFDEWNWHLDTRVTASGKDINPDVIGYIFEKYINQKEMGAYYTKEDITGYIGKNTIIPFLLDKVKSYYPSSFESGSGFWQYLQDSGDEYIYDSVKKGAEGLKSINDVNIPDNIRIGIDTTKPNLLERRKDWNTATPSAGDEIGLPTEIWRETIARLQRYYELKEKIKKGGIQEINDLITYNLNIVKLVQDYLEQTQDTEFVRNFHKALCGITVLDPTCGSGAFLFAALNILEPLYEICIRRIEEFITNNAKGKNDFKDRLADIEYDKHPNNKYYIYKTIILNNLYGVDLMKEAVEIAKLRLFLKLVAEVDPSRRSNNYGLEPLPDIDFNIRAGNTLVGFATEQHLEEVVKNTEGNLMYKEKLDDLKSSCETVADYYEHFQKVQISVGSNSEKYKEIKKSLINELKTLDEKLSRYLADTYGLGAQTQWKSKKEKENAYQEWKESHQPFHWFAEFYEIISKGGFDVVIGNPPYVEYIKVKNDYSIKDIQCISAGNLYVYVVERSIILTKKKSKIGMIIQLSAFCTPRMLSFQDQLLKHTQQSYLSFFDDRPGKLFDGLEHIRVAICINEVGHCEKSNLLTTNYIKFPSEMREFLFEGISYLVNNDLINNTISKLNKKIEQNILLKIFKDNYKLQDYYDNSGKFSLYYHNAPQYYIRAHSSAPYFWNEKDGEKTSVQNKRLIFSTETNRDLVLTILASTIFYWWFVLHSDCRHLNAKEIDKFPINLDAINTDIKSVLTDISKNLEEDLKKNSYRKETVYKATGKVIYDEFYPKKSKPIIDEIDKVLAKHYGFTDEELDFIINYDIKYRMGSELEGEE